MMESIENSEILNEQTPQKTVGIADIQSQKGVDSTPKYKITFEGDAAIKLTQITEELKKRGVEVRKLWTLVSEEILNKSASYWDKWMEEVTPGDFYLEAIKQDPEMEAKLESFLKQMYLGKGKTHPTNKRVKRNRPTETVTSVSEDQ